MQRNSPGTVRSGPVVLRPVIATSCSIDTVGSVTEGHTYKRCVCVSLKANGELASPPTSKTMDTGQVTSAPVTVDHELDVLRPGGLPEMRSNDTL